MLRTIHFQGYRSLRDFRLNLGRVTVVTGENGVGKSNVYRALGLMRKMAEGRFAEAVAEEGGLPSLLWAGDLKKGEMKRMRWEIAHEDFHIEMECGMIPAVPGPGDPSMFKTDPDIKLETLRFGGKDGRVMAKRKGPAVELRSNDGKLAALPLPVHATESMLSEVRDGAHYPAVMAARETLLSWRFYHHFATDARSALRQTSVGFWSPVLDGDGGNLAANLQTLVECERATELNELFEKAFPDCEWSAVDEMGKFQLRLLRPGLKRWLDASELSDGTLRFFCLCAALMTTKPPPLLILNEPEASLHADLIAPLAELIVKASRDSQIIIVSHSKALVEAISERCEAKVVDLVSHDGRTEDRNARSGSGGRVWEFGD
ncbi:MAG: AAA family ATPase [Akkermansiaceae bacterium]|jgi:predicted ATPase|nr:AAA family ATPase [Akkermansiaceae bacterium]MDP4780399.1 AAA family ATPase [Akkermansiaceae bacterium]MDP4898034.1 AAA family ATPase [Akkermansiaceae bacterium]